MRCVRVFVCALLWCADTHSRFCADYCFDELPPEEKKIFSLFFFLFAAQISPSLPSFSRVPFPPFSLLSSLRVETLSWRPICPSFGKKKKSVRVHLFSIFFLLLLVLPHIFIAWIYTHTHTYIYKHTHTLHIHINNGIRNDQLFVDAVWRVVGLLFFLEKKFDDQQPIIRCF